MRGRFDGRGGALGLPIASAAVIALRTIFYAGHQAYAETDTFRFLDERLVMRYGQDLLPHIAGVMTSGAHGSAHHFL